MSDNSDRDFTNRNVSIIPDRWFNEGTNLRHNIGLSEIPFMEFTFNAKQVSHLLS